MTISALDQAAADFRAALLRRDDAALKRLMTAYQPAYTRMQARVAALTAQIATAQAAGETVRPSWLVERGRLETLQHQIVSEWARFADVAEQVITDTQRAAVVAAHTEAHQLTLAALHDARVTTGADVVRLPVAALHELIGVLGDGSPLRTLLDKLGQQAAQDVGDTLTHAVAVGRNPRRTARDIQDALGGNLNRALTIARTEQIRAYRNASLQTYQANHELLRGWRWLASPSRRTCPVCLAMDGTEHGLDDPFASHQCCRCCPVPLLRDRETPPHETGAEWFAKQDEATQREMIGPGKQKLYAEGKLTLADLVGVKEDAQWGKSRYQRSIGDALAAAGKREAGVATAAQTFVPPYPIPQSLGAAVTLNAQLQAMRLNQIAALPPGGLEQQIARMAIPQALPKLDYHFQRHGHEFGATLPQDYVQMFDEHIRRSDLMYFTGLRQSDQAMMWYLIAPDTGATAQYNETRGVYWSFFQPKDPIVYLDRGLLWWVEITQAGGQWIAQPWR